ncbi:MAG: aminotransferase class I/II-fold pyridoxal phosphate-dependent enzyme, partial [Desulfobacula sp.]|nr:aminotransferase class I/II-fold pyridoxal phosphate-dependent enzyme [Desulfobacula sp.]
MNNINFNSKQPELQLSIFAVMTQLAMDHDAINLSQGFPDFNCDDQLIDLVTKYMKKGSNQYAPMPGVLELRMALAKKIQSLYNHKYDHDNEITITAGATEALFSAFTAFIQPGDEIIVFEPWYDAYIAMIEYNGGKPVYLPLSFPDFKIDWTEVKNSINEKTKAIVVNSPHNPSGALISKHDIEQLCRIVKDTDVLIICDEVYEHITFDNGQHYSLSMFPELAQRSLVISSFGKTYHTTGWKIGYCTAPEYLTHEFRKAHQFITYAVNTPVQYAYAEFLENQDIYQGLNKFYQDKRDKFRKHLESSRFKIL